MPAKICVTKSEIYELHYLSVKYNTNFLNQEQLITKIRNLRGDNFVDMTVSLAIITTILMLANNANGFQTNPHMNVPPHLQWLHEKKL